jgi:HD-GYP domain-containing protein (c-di-GMP phosphodiesterase class II)
MRLADLLAGLSRLADLGFGIQAGEALRTSVLAAELARSLDLPDEDIRAGLYTGLLHHAGCTAYAHETAREFGDEHALNLATLRTNLAQPRETVTTFLPRLTHGRAPLERARLTYAAFTRGRRHGTAYVTAVCEVGRDAARRLRLPDEVQTSVYHSYELWNGQGLPEGLKGEDIPPGARVARVASTAALFDTFGGAELAVETVRQRAGGMLDPRVAAHFLERAEALLGDLGARDPHERVLDAEPPPVARVPGQRLVEVAEVFGDLADLKIPHTYGHSRGVAALARAAGEQVRLAPSDLDDLELAGLLHDVGRVAISNTVWDKADRLSAHEWEQVRLHAYHSERILAGSEELARLGRLVGMHHERADGSGYHRGCTAADLSMSSRLLAAADAYQAMTQPRPHRSALTAEQAERQLLQDAHTGRLDAEAVGAVLTAAGHEARVRREAPAGLTAREVEVLRLLAEGCRNAEIAGRLVISRRTAEHHVQHIYTKLGVSSRAAAALFAMEHGLLTKEDR